MERKSVCKYCFKRFPCGKSLGGHIRTHMSEERTSNAAAAVADHDAALNFNLKLDSAERRRKKRDLWSESDASIYGLRENPKKTMRFVHSDSNAAAATFEHEADEKFCKECGKGFPSLKALCGHMACHSDKDKRINNNIKVVMDNTSSQSDTTDQTCVPRRSKRFRSLTLSNHKHNHHPSSLDYASSPISYSEVEQEVKNGAMCLILLSRDPNHIDMDHFASQNNLFLLETKSSSSFDANIDFKNGNNFVEKKLIKDIKLKSVEFGGFEGYRSNVDAKRANYDSIGDNLVDKRENSWKYESYDDGDSIDYESDEKSSESDSYTSKAVINGKKKKSSKVKKKKKKKLKSKKSKEHECPICYRIFKSGQALGGHKRSHFVGGSEENTLVIKQAAAVPCLIDLNLPAPVDE